MPDIIPHLLNQTSPKHMADWYEISLLLMNYSYLSLTIRLSVQLICYFLRHMRGTALGGWLVLEPWITPSLFYQFLGASEKFGDDGINYHFHE